jgi:hypothetical protein
MRASPSGVAKRSSPLRSTQAAMLDVEAHAGLAQALDPGAQQRRGLLVERKTRPELPTKVSTPSPRAQPRSSLRPKARSQRATPPARAP